jgi:hypothetical protein
MMNPELPARIVCSGCWPLREDARPGRPGDQRERCACCAKPIDGPPFVSPADRAQERRLCLGCWQNTVGHDQRLAEREAKRLAFLGPRLLVEAACLVSAWDHLPAELPARIEALRQILSEARAA